MLKRAKPVCIALILVMAAYEVMLFAWSNIAEHKAARITELLGILRPGYTTMDSAKALFQAHGVDVLILNNACGDPRGPCDSLNLGAANFPRIIPIHVWRLAGITLLPLPPVNTAYLQVNLYFINGILGSINVGYEVGTTGIRYSRYAGAQFRNSKWTYSNEGKVVSIGVVSKGEASDVPFPHFSLNYMYSVKSPDLRELWPSAPPPTTELHKQD
jgi:hypothetical protein